MDILEEDEKQREEELEKWWKENWKSIFGGVLLAIFLIVSVYFYRDYVTRQRQHGANEFYSLVLNGDINDPRGLEAVKSFIADHNDVYGELAASVLVTSQVSAGKYEEALESLKVMTGFWTTCSESGPPVLPSLSKSTMRPRAFFLLPGMNRLRAW